MRRNGKGAEGRDVREEADIRKAMAVREKEICPARYHMQVWRVG